MNFKKSGRVMCSSIFLITRFSISATDAFASEANQSVETTKTYKQAVLENFKEGDRKFMMKKVRKLGIALLVVLSIGGGLSSTKSYAAATMSEEELALINISSIVNQEDISEEDVAILESELAKLGVDAPSYFTLEDYESMALARGYGQWHDLGGGWRAKVDKPHTGEGLPHVHVEKNKVKGAESTLGTKSHGKTLTSSGVPKSVQKKAKALKDYKKGQEDAKNIRKAKSQIKAKN